MKLVILTGMSGAGKSTALKMMEDIGFYCVDNLPIPLIEKFIELADLRNTELQKVAVGVDIRSGQALEDLQDILDHLRGEGKEFDVLFLDAEDGVLVKRYKETRRSHPLAGSDRVDKGIEEERRRLEFLKKQANYIIDTSHLLTRELKTELNKIFVENQEFKNLFITILSFGIKPEKRLLNMMTGYVAVRARLSNSECRYLRWQMQSWGTQSSCRSIRRCSWLTGRTPRGC